MTVASQETPGVSITASSTEICLGMMVTFTATPANGGSAPVYQWQVNGINAGTNSPTFTASNLNNAGVVTCKMTGNSTCAPGTATSNSIVIFVTAQATPAVDITASSENICQGASVTFTAAPTNGGNAPTYQWLLNGSSVGTNSPTYTTTNLTGSDNVSCQMTGNASCASGLATSNTITVGVSTPVAPSLIITPSLTAICSGTVVTFTATSINGGNDPSYDWSVNGVSVGGNAPVFMTSALNNGDQVNCKMTSTAGCVTADRASSNTFVETVTTRLSSAVSISASANNVCSGTQVTFTGIPTNGGDTPAYHWLVNGNSSGGDSTAFTTSSLRNGDSINCIITSSLPCATTDTSSAVYMSVLPLPTVTFDPDTLYANNGDIRLTPVVTGPVSQYQWSPANGLTSATISDPVADAVDNSTYEVIVTTDSGCTAEAKVTVIADRPLQMPNAFTPNGDGHNDVFRVPPGIDLKMSGFQIFNRWGTEVFSTRNSGQGWDGTSHGIPCPAGTYVYLITGFTVSDKQVSLKGTVILIR
jgi:gliding motility-associated-like protein